MNIVTATIITNLAICGVVIGALLITNNPLALAGLMLMRAIPTDSDLCDAVNSALSEGEDSEDHQRREVGFSAKYDEN